MENHDIADSHDQVAGGSVRQLWGKVLLLVFELDEFDFDEFVLGQRIIDRLNEAIRQTSLADFQNRVQELRGCLEPSNFRIDERFQHLLTLCSFRKHDQKESRNTLQIYAHAVEGPEELPLVPQRSRLYW
jgi:hypothetical protein